MKILFSRDEGELTILLSGDLDHHSARVAIPEISGRIDTELPVSLVLDFSDVRFMDSSGIALAINAYKRSSLIGCTFRIINVPAQAYKVFSAAGISGIINIHAKEIKV